MSHLQYYRTIVVLIALSGLLLPQDNILIMYNYVAIIIRGQYPVPKSNQVPYGVARNYTEVIGIVH